MRRPVALALALLASPAWASARPAARHGDPPYDLGPRIRAALKAISPGDPLVLHAPSGKSFSVDSTELGTFMATAVEIQVIQLWFGPVRFGPVLGFGAAWIPHVVDRSAHMQAFGPGLFVEMGLTAGVSLPRLGRLEPAVEVLAGAEGVEVPLYHSDPMNHAGGLDRTSTLSQVIVEPRLVLDVRVSPHFTVGAWAGANVLRAGEPCFGLALTGTLLARDTR